MRMRRRSDNTSTALSQHIGINPIVRKFHGQHTTSGNGHTGHAAIVCDDTGVSVTVVGWRQIRLLPTPLTIRAYHAAGRIPQLLPRRPQRRRNLIARLIDRPIHRCSRPLHNSSVISLLTRRLTRHIVAMIKKMQHCLPGIPFTAHLVPAGYHTSTYRTRPATN